MPDFNSHARVGRDDGYSYVTYDGVHFNSHARVGRDTQTAPSWTICAKFQLTRPRGA